MGLNGSMSGITFGGLSSGIDTNSIIQKLLQLEANPLKTYQARLQDIQTQQTVMQQFRTRLQGLNSAALTLNSPYAFNPIKATSSDSAVATVTGSNASAPGIYSLGVSRLAQAQKIATAAQADPTSALDQAGTFVVNGKVVKVAASDSLQKIAQNINSANAGVTASIIDGGAGRAYMTLAANSSGIGHRIQIADATGAVVSSLGIVTGNPSAREPIANGVSSYGFSSPTQTLAELLPESGITSGTFSVNGVQVGVDFSTDTLQTLASKLTAAGSPSAVRTVTQGSSTAYKLDIVSGIGGDVFSDPQNILQSIGVLQRAPGSELVAAQDASYTLDGVSLTSDSNTITTAIPGTTLTLLKANETTPATTTITLSKDLDGIKQQLHAFADAYNSAIDFVNQYSQFDKDTFETGPLFGDPVARQVVQTVSSLLFSNMPGVTGPYRNLAAIGFGFDDKGKLTVDDSRLDTALNASPDSLGSLFQTVGRTSANSLIYIAAGNATKSGTYNIEITALPIAASYTADVAQSAPTGGTETLTFAGALIGSTPYSLVIPQNRTQAEIVSQINSDSRLGALLEASVDASGRLVLTAKNPGSASNFTVSSDRANAEGDTSGIGSGTDGTKVAGADLQGTINGEPATGGPNNMLIGNAGNASTAGLQVQVGGAALGLIGSVTVNKGMSAMITDLMVQFTDPVSGLLTTRDQSLTAQQTDVNDSISRLQARVQRLQLELQTKFAAMENAIARIQQQSAQLQNSLKSLGG